MARPSPWVWSLGGDSIGGVPAAGREHVANMHIYIYIYYFFIYLFVLLIYLFICFISLFIYLCICVFIYLCVSLLFICGVCANKFACYFCIYIYS